jgi:hypothetical protein
MKLVMDSDCLIKLTCAGSKELACRAFAIAIPADVKREVVDDGGERPDALAVERSIKDGLLAVVAAAGDQRGKGEDWTLRLYGQGGFDGICSDDRRSLAKLRVLGVPYLTPAALIVVLANRGHLSRGEAMGRLAALGPLISPDEYTVARLKLGEVAVPEV